ncbi:Pre-mRNA-splicing factor cwc26 [Neophaeococcomyces mojaviensis]|uniref:Pre-mRNA-splicing factor cwc26 n=1 Tax=Neophaeococcomyces mojaviensis TaxID=3383035 RepID=A0ACC2ZVX2_9EURO|nr:Pre-mRNA-splicing factor cwc26 [Knufia sp. JES_112]
MPVSADYLTKYLSASNSKSSATNPDYDDSNTRPKKRRKKDKHADSTTGALLIADDDADLLLNSLKHKARADEDEDGPLVYNTKIRSAEFRKKTSSNWQSVQDNDTTQQQSQSANGTKVSRGGVDDADEADAILAAAAADSDRRREAIEAEDAPAVVETSAGTDEGPRMSSGARAGLQTAADTAALIAAEEARENEEQRRAKKKKKRDEDIKPEQGQETIYRDATGRRIDIALRRAEVRKEELAKQAAEKKAKESAMGEVQLRQKEQAKQELEDAKFLTLGRTADDEEMNEGLKEEVRWDDPMARYMAERQAEKDAEEASRHGGRRKGKAGVGDGVVVRTRKEYAGAAPPNRYGIKPGWRWDGVDRGNGFEKEWFQARGRKARNENLEYQWAMDE